MANLKSSRRGFIKKVAGTAFTTSLIPSVLAAGSREPIYLEAPTINRKSYAPNDQVNVAIIGMGIGIRAGET